MPGCGLSIPALFLTVSIARTVFRCVVSKDLQALFVGWFFPSAGFRERPTGMVSGIGSYGYFSCSSPLSTDVWRPRFAGDYGSMGAGGGRTCAFGVRCVQAFTGSVSGWFSSRLRGFGAIRRECLVLSVPTGMCRYRFHRVLMPCVRSSSRPVRISMRKVAVHMAFHCVVSKRLQVLFRDVFFPAAGNRHRETGALTNVGSEGVVWAVSASGIYSRFLDFYSSSVFLNTLSRSYGFALRCVQAFTGSGSG